MTDVFQTVRLNDLNNYYSAIDEIDLDTVNEYSQNLLHEAVTNNCVEIAMDLLSREINVNQQDKNGQTPLHFAAAHHRIKLAGEIINKGGDINICDVHGNNALWTAVFNARGNYELVELFVEKGGDAVTKNKHNRSALDFAHQINDENLIQLLKGA